MRPRAFFLVAVALGAAACHEGVPPEPGPAPSLVEVATSPRQWTGVTETPDGRIFVSFPRWSADVAVSVGELLPNGTVRPYPDERWNAWSEGEPAGDRFVCVQSVVADGDGSLWVLDPASPRFSGVVPGGAKLVEIDLATGAVGRTVGFGPDVAPPASYLNDVRIDRDRNAAFVTDSGTGAIVVVDLVDGTSRRVLAGAPSTRSEGVEVVIDGKPWLRADGSRPEVHADGIALDPRRSWLYFRALTARTLYRAPVDALLDRSIGDGALAVAVERVVETGPADGMVFGPDGSLYLTDLERSAILRVDPVTSAVTTVVADPRLAWPDTLAIGPDGSLLVTTSEIHRMPDPPEPFRLFRLSIAGEEEASKP